ATDRLHQVGAALEGNVVELDAQLLSDEFGGEVRTCEGAGGAVAQLSWIGLGIGDEIVPVLDRSVGRHHDAEGIAGEIEDIADVLDRIPVDLGGVGEAEYAQG